MADMTASRLDPCRLDIARLINERLMALLPEGAEPGAELAVMSIYQALEKPPEAKMGDFALPCFRFAKALRKKPQEVAEALRETFAGGATRWVERAETVGAFLNLFLDQTVLAASLLPRILDRAYFETYVEHPETSNKRVMIEYSQPNTHKVFHVGHMRNVALGDSLWRLYAYCGYPVTPVNYVGDEGAHIAKCLWYIKRFDKKAPSEGRGEWLGEMYTEATHALEDADEATRKDYEQEISAVLRAIESKSGPTYELWRETRQWSLDIFQEIYGWLGARFDHFFFESDVSEESQEIVDTYLAKGVFSESEGAIGVDLKQYKAGYALVRKRDGNTLYLTKDLALARRKFDEFHIDKSIYVVASEQNLHFKQVFKILELMGFPQAKDCYHLSYGMVVLPDGKMSSRKGNVIAFSELKDRMSGELGKYLDKYADEWSAEERSATTHKLCAGAIKFGMLASDPAKDIVFDLQDWLSFEGYTGPYLMYSYARTRSILRKAAEQGFAASRDHLDKLVAEEERDLMRYLYDFNDIVWQSCHGHKPSTLAHHLFDMAKSFNRLHSQLSVLKAESDELRSARLSLLEAFSAVLRQGLELLGMEPPERM